MPLPHTCYTSRLSLQPTGCPLTCPSSTTHVAGPPSSLRCAFWATRSQMSPPGANIQSSATYSAHRLHRPGSTILTCTWLSPVRNPATWSSSPPPPLPNPQALQPVVHLGFQRDLPPLPTVSGHCLPVFLFPLYLNPLQTYTSVFYVVFLFLFSPPL